jgi:hypothetical protein
MMKFSLHSHFIHLRAKYSPQNPVLRHAQSMFVSYKVRDHDSSSCKNTGKMTVLKAPGMKH